MRYRYIAAPAVVHTLQAGFLVHPADSKYAELHTDLSLLQPGGPERAMLEHYLLVGGLGFRVLTRTAFLICQLRLLHKECPPAGGVHVWEGHIAQVPACLLGNKGVTQFTQGRYSN